MKLEFFCGGVLEYTQTYRQLAQFPGVQVTQINFANRTLQVDGVTQKNHEEICYKMQELGWRTCGFLA